MKGIVLIGASRAGKSTFSQMLMQELKSCQIISGDLVRLDYRDEIYKDKTVKAGLMKEIPEYRKFLKSYFDYSVKYSESLYVILDTVDFKPEDYKLFENNIIIVFGYPDLTKEECLSNWRTYQDSKDWTRNKSDKILLEKAEREIAKSKQFEKDAKKYKLKFVNTSFTRKIVLTELLEWVKNELNKKQ